MNCPTCNAFIEFDSQIFCGNCQNYVASPLIGTKAALHLRILAYVISSMLIFVFLTIFNLLKENTFLQFIIFVAFLTLIFWFYSKGLTPGKYILRLRVINTDTKKPSSFWNMFFREFIGKLISSLFYLGFIWAILDPNNQTWHDKLAHTVVVKETDQEHINIKV